MLQQGETPPGQAPQAVIDALFEYLDRNGKRIHSEPQEVTPAAVYELAAKRPIAEIDERRYAFAGVGANADGETIRFVEIAR